LVRKDCYQRHQVIGDDLHEDFVCWLGFLRAGGIARGINEPLLIYRVSSNSKSGNKLRSAAMTWRSYRTVGLHILAAAYYMVWYTLSGLMKHRHLK
jgi:teichuronic acid biosynthesis glycosyltransferase TuaG